MSAAAIKTRMATILAGGANHCVGSGARDSLNLPCSPMSPDAVKWDIMGALVKANIEWNIAESNALYNYTFFHEVYEAMKLSVWPNWKTDDTIPPVADFVYDLELWQDTASWAQIATVIA